MGFIKKNKVYLLFLICFLVTFARAFKGFCWTDESFYVSTADRFYRGIVPLVGEWYRTQMSSVLMLPFYASYVAITGSNAGVILYFRILYLLLSFSVGIVYYRILKKEYPEIISAIPALFVMFYAHLNNATCSYYMFSFLFLILGLILVYDHKNTNKKSELVFAGIFIALAVFCMPLFAMGYVLVMAAVFALMLIRRFVDLADDTKTDIDSLDLKSVSLYTIIGIAIPAVIFLVYLVSHVDMEYLLNTLPYALVDNEHNESLGYFIRKPNRCLTEVYGTYLTYASYVLIAATFIFGRFIKKKMIRHIVVFADAVIFVMMSYLSMGHTGYIQVAFFMFAVPVYFVSEKKNRVLFWLMSVPGVLVALIYCFASSDFLYVMAIGASVANGACVCALYDYVSGSFAGEEGTSKIADTAVKFLIAAVIVFSLVTTAYLRMKNVYRDAPVSELTHKITTGVAKGLYTTEEHLGQYRDVYDMINEYCKGTDKGNVMFSKILPWGYIASDLGCGYPTTWRATTYDAEQLEMYYTVNPDARPDIIVVLDEQYGSYDAAGDVEDDHNPNLDEMNDYWKDYISDNGFTEKKVKCGKVYCKIKQ